MLGRRLINTGGAACTTDTVQILDALKTESTALYRFEDNANDTASTSGKFGKGAIFSGSSSDTISTASSPLNFGTSDYSVSLWVNTRTLAANQALICPYDGNGLLVNIVQPNGYIRFYHNGGTLVNISTSAITANTWYHVCVTMDHSAAAKIYINGNLENTKTGSNLGTDPGGTFNIGNQPTHSSYYMQGRMDQVRVFNKALSQSEVTTLYNETTSTVNTLQVLGDTSCVATYTFEGNANDLSTNYNGTASGNITYDYSGTASNITYATGKFGKAAVFNGTDSRITIPAISAITGDVTFSVWANINSLSHTRRLRLIEINANSNGYAGSLTVMYKPSNGEFKIRAGNGTSSNSDVITHNYVLTADQWYHIAITRNNTTNVSKLYINNIEVDSETVSVNSSYPSNAQTFIGDYIGSSSYNYNWDGELDQIRIFNKALSSGEVNSLYNETATSAASATIDSPSTIAYYKMADASDETGSYNGTATNVDFNVQGKYGFAGKFNGSSSRINTGLTWPGGTEISCSLWINTAGGVNQYLLGGFNDSGANASNRFAFQFHNSNVLYILTNGAGGGLGTTTNAGSIASYLNKWTHIVVTVSGTEVKAYLDGSLFHTSTGTALAAGSHPFIIGAYTDNSSRQNVNGKIDQVRIFNKAISASEVTKLYNEIQCANTIATPESYFNTKLITPTTSSSALPVTGVGFAPDLVWAKYRGTGSGASTQSHYWVDSVRGINSRVFSNSNSAESTSNYVQSFDSDGITYVNNLFNRTGADSVVGWFWKAGGITHKAASFPGNASIPTSAYLGSNWNSVPFSISFWGKHNSGNDLYAMGTGNATGWAISFRNTSPKYVYMISGNNCKITYTTGEWKHFVYTFDGSSTIKGYGNSILEDTRAPHTYFGSTSPITIGKYGLAGSNFNGEIAQVRLFNKELSQSEINTVYAETASTLNTLQILGDTSCVATWPLGTNADDLSGNYSGTSSTNVTFGVPGFLMRNTNGTITSTVSTSQESGFSVVKYSPNNTVGMSIGHGLSKAPSLVITKRLDTSQDWGVYTNVSTGTTATNWLSLNDSDAYGSGSYMTIKSTTLELPASGAFWASPSSRQIAYCFANIDGYQRIGSYVGTGGFGPFVYTGFEPAWLLIKEVTNTGNWCIYDNKRDTENPNNKVLAANSSNPESSYSSGYNVNFHTNGFEIAENTSNDLNTFGNTYLFWAIAANPDTTEPTKANSFKTVTYSGNGISGTSITGTGFKPDLTWVKVRTQGYYHFWHDSVRLVQSDYYLVSSDTNAQGTGGEASQRISSFDDDGFTISGTGNLSNLNRSPGHDYVSWNWKALDHDRGLPSINSDGTIQSLVSSNQNAGFSIVKYFGNTTAGATVGHGLSAKPEWIFIKNLDQSVAWMAYDTNINNVGYLSLNDDFQTGRLAWAFNSTAPTTKTVTLGYNGGTAVNSGDNFIMYLWHSVPGHSKIGSYTISSSSDRIITGLGFTPSWVMVKRTDSTGAWVITDTSRGITKEIYANLNNSENTDSNGVQSFDTDGFTVGTGSWLGATGGTYIYMAFK